MSPSPSSSSPPDQYQKESVREAEELNVEIFSLSISLYLSRGGLLIVETRLRINNVIYVMCHVSPSI